MRGAPGPTVRGSLLRAAGSGKKLLFSEIIRYSGSPASMRQLVIISCAGRAPDSSRSSEPELHVGDPVAHKCVPHKFRTACPQMHHTGTTHKRPNEADHEVNCVVGWQDTQIPNSRPGKWIPTRSTKRIAPAVVLWVEEAHPDFGRPPVPTNTQCATSLTLPASAKSERPLAAAKSSQPKTSRQIAPGGAPPAGSTLASC